MGPWSAPNYHFIFDLLFTWNIGSLHIENKDLVITDLTTMRFSITSTRVTELDWHRDSEAPPVHVIDDPVVSQSQRIRKYIGWICVILAVFISAAMMIRSGGSDIFCDGIKLRVPINAFSWTWWALNYAESHAIYWKVGSFFIMILAFVMVLAWPCLCVRARSGQCGLTVAYIVFSLISIGFDFYFIHTRLDFEAIIKMSNKNVMDKNGAKRGKDYIEIQDLVDQSESVCEPDPEIAECTSLWNRIERKREKFKVCHGHIDFSKGKTRCHDRNIYIVAMLLAITYVLIFIALLMFDCCNARRNDVIPTDEFVTITALTIPVTRKMSNFSITQIEILTHCSICGMAFEGVGRFEAVQQHRHDFCPMTMQCPECFQVIDLHVMNNHLRKECTNRELYTLCQSCHVPIKSAEMDQHIDVDIESGRIDEEKVQRCVLCLERIEPDTIEAWRRHLIGPTGCVENRHRFRCEAPKDNIRKASEIY